MQNTALAAEINIKRCVVSPGLCARKPSAVAVRRSALRHVPRSGVLLRASTTLPAGTSIKGAPQPRRFDPAPPSVFGSLEALLARTFSSQRTGQRSDWEEIEGNWVLRPPHNSQPEAVVHFLGGAFVGAAPQLSYRLFLEALAARNVLVITTPFGTSFDELRTADEVWYKFDRATKALQEEVGRLPVYGVGHAHGSMLHLLIGSRYSVNRAGNALMAFNNRPATDVIPFLSPFIAPSARAAGPLLAQLAASPLRTTVEAASDGLRGLSPSLVRQLLPLFEQLTPIYMDVAQGRREFSPAPDEAGNLIRNYYGVPRNLLLRFRDDAIDETIALASLLENSSTLLSRSLDINVRTLKGDHLRPMTQALVDLPPEVAKLANEAALTGGSLIGRLAGMASQAGLQQAAVLNDLSKSVTNLAPELGGHVGGPVTDGVQALADEVVAWMGISGVVVSGNKALPAASVRAPPPAGEY